MTTNQITPKDSTHQTTHTGSISPTSNTMRPQITTIGLNNLGPKVQNSSSTRSPLGDSVSNRSLPYPATTSVTQAATRALPINIENSNLAEYDEIKTLMDYLKASPTAFHAVLEAKKICLKNGFVELNNKKKWDIQPEGKYFLIRDDSSFIAFVCPKSKPTSACIFGAHTDSPGLKLKPNPEKKVDNAVLLCSEVYGGPIISSWFDRSLGLAGRIVYRDQNGETKSSLIDLEKTVGSISHVAIHLDRTLAEKHEVNRQEHLPAVCWINSDQEQCSSHLETELKKIVPYSTLLSHELFFIPRESHEIVNNNQIHGAKLDNLLGVHASLYALMKNSQPEENRLKMVVFWDHEEVGSESFKGAASNFLDDVFYLSLNALGLNFSDALPFKNNSLLVSIDAAHARHPNYIAKHEPNHAPLLGKGPVIKYHANQSYATNAVTAAFIKMAADKSGVPLQDFCVRSDTQCGSTIGNIVAPKMGIQTVDIGSSVLGMHSIREKGHLLDHIYMCKLLETLFKMDFNAPCAQ